MDTKDGSEAIWEKDWKTNAILGVALNVAYCYSIKWHHGVCCHSHGSNIPSMVQVHVFRVSKDCHLMSRKNE